MKGRRIPPMETPYVTLRLSQIDMALYRWAALIGEEGRGEGVEANVTACLSVAADELPSDALVRVDYNGIALGTWRRKWLQDDPSGCADRMIEAYDALMVG